MSYIPKGADAYYERGCYLTPEEQDLEALEALDLPDATLEALATQADWEARCEAFAWKVALGLAGGDAWVCERLALAGLMDGTDPADLRGEV
jgi:hypothetical protein